MTHPLTIPCLCLTHPGTFCACFTHPISMCHCLTHPLSGCMCLSHPVTCVCVTHPGTICPPGSICAAMTHQCIGSIIPGCGVSGDPGPEGQAVDPQQLAALKEQLQQQIKQIEELQQKQKGSK